MNKDLKKIGIIGAGPAGLTAAITAGKVLKTSERFSDWKIDLFEKNDEPGRKLLATGNGRCNITNEFAEDFQLSYSFFNDLGVVFAKEDRGRMYPYSRQARNVRDILVKTALAYDVDILSNTDIESVKHSNDIFVLKDKYEKEYEYSRLIITTGGKAGIQYGSTGDGFKFARDMGIKVKKILPSLVPMTYGDDQQYDLKKLKGVRAEAKLTLMIDGEEIADEYGEIQFTDYGISGICVFDLSRFLEDIKRETDSISDCTVLIDLLPQISEKELALLLDSGAPAGLKGIVNEKLERLLLDRGLDPQNDSIQIAETLKHFPLNIDGTKGWKEAQITSGGVPLEAIDTNCMESHEIPSLFFAGEILDYDGPCGGFNLNWAWKSGIQAGLGVINGIK